MKFKTISFIIYLFVYFLASGCSIKVTRSTHMSNEDLYKKIVNESSKPIVYSTLWYYCTYHEWPENKDDLEFFLSEGNASIDLSQYTMINIHEKEDGNLLCTYTIKGQKRMLTVDINFKDFTDNNFDCSMFPPHKSTEGIYRL